MSIELQERKLTWDSFPQVFSDMKFALDGIKAGLEHEFVRAALIYHGSKDDKYHWYFIADVYDSDDQLVLFMERDSSHSNPRFALKNRETEIIRLIRGVSVSANVDEMQAIHQVVLDMILGGQGLKERDVPLAIHLKRPRHN